MRRKLCNHCLRCTQECFCSLLQPFESEPKFVILSHPKEFRKAINTGKIINRSLTNASLFQGIDFTYHNNLNKMLVHPELQCFLLFPTQHAFQLEQMPPRSHACKTRVFILLDATWAMAKQIYKLSSNLWHLPKVSFQTPLRSQYKIRTQPNEHCLSSVESVFHVIQHFDKEGTHAHLNKNMLGIFHRMVQRQMDYESSRSVSRV